jgi:hypothetical protein
MNQNSNFFRKSDYLGVFLHGIVRIFKAWKNFYVIDKRGGIPIGVTSSGQNQKIPSDSKFPYRKTPEYKKSDDLKFIWKVEFFTPWSPLGEKLEFPPIFSNRLIFCIQGIFRYGNLNLKEIFDYDRYKLPLWEVSP